MILSEAAQDLLYSHDWPGNVRELESAIVRGIHFAADTLIEVEHLRLSNSTPEGPQLPFPGSGKLGTFRRMKQTVVERFERDYLVRLMEEHRGNITQAALFAGKERRDLGRLLKRHQLSPNQFSPDSTD
jgi:DNA-binding NtrC family response regulator